MTDTIASPTGAGSQVIRDPRPLAQLAILLQYRYAKAVTYEDPLWVWTGELQAGGRANPTAKWALIPITRALSLPALLNTSQGPSAILTQAVAQYNSRPESPQFKVTTWELGFHVIPTRVHDESGALVDSSNPLDLVISIPEGERSATEHFQQLCAAVSAASGVTIKLMPPGIRPGSLDQLFAVEPSPFSWGGNDMVARDALSELVLRSATTLSWQLRCQASAQAQDRFCFLNIQPLEVETTDAAGKPITKTLTYDRCGECPHRSGLAPPPPPQ
ncbi:MAG: hypothetical protein M3Y72_17345 [Acidobacteriota bacterium]|nr:hypothetical protein [Acidobacteriota bacterium]MDQ2842765.1 hypothetical protein [Acidobacteriota bacterium]